jgi:hypothetical protein
MNAPVPYDKLWLHWRDRAVVAEAYGTDIIISPHDWDLLNSLSYTGLKWNPYVRTSRLLGRKVYIPWT